MSFTLYSMLSVSCQGYDQQKCKRLLDLLVLVGNRLAKSCSDSTEGVSSNAQRRMKEQEDLLR